MTESRFAIIPADAIDDLRLTGTDLRVLGVISYHLSRERGAYPKQKTIAERINITREAVNRCCARLKKFGYLQVVKQSRTDGGQRENLYFVPLYPNIPPPDLGGGPDGEPQGAPPPVIARVTPPVTAAITPKDELTIRTKPPKPPRGRGDASLEVDPLVRSAFEAIWRSWPAKGLERSAGRDVCLLEFVKATRKAAPDALKIAASAYVASCKPAYAVGLNRWLKLGQWENFLPSPQAVKRQEARKLHRVTGKAGECLDAIVARWGEAKARAWLSDATWTETFVRLPSEFQAQQVRTQFGAILDLYGFSVSVTGEAVA